MAKGKPASYQDLFSQLDIEPGGCWTWTGCLMEGYGVYGSGKKGKLHRSRLVYLIVYEFLVAPVPEGKQLDHLCRNRACANPAHLEAVPQKTNLMRGEGACAQNARKTHCKHGHEFTPENTGQHKSGGRYCLTCSREAAKRQRAKNHKGKRLNTSNAPKWKVTSR